MGILLGCDYCESIKGIGPQKAVKLIQEYGSIEGVLSHLDSKKYTIPENWRFEEARNLFMNPEVLPPGEAEQNIKWASPNESLIVEFLVREKGFKYLQQC